LVISFTSIKLRLFPLGLLSQTVGSVWREVYDSATGQAYYWNTFTGHIQWDVPPDYEYHQDNPDFRTEGWSMFPTAFSIVIVVFLFFLFLFIFVALPSSVATRVVCRANQGDGGFESESELEEESGDALPRPVKRAHPPPPPPLSAASADTSSSDGQSSDESALESRPRGTKRRASGHLGAAPALVQAKTQAQAQAQAQAKAQASEEGHDTDSSGSIDLYYCSEEDDAESAWGEIQVLEANGGSRGKLSKKGGASMVKQR
jgi:hypothetical protein